MRVYTGSVVGKVPRLRMSSTRPAGWLEGLGHWEDGKHEGLLVSSGPIHGGYSGCSEWIDADGRNASEGVSGFLCAGR